MNNKNLRFALAAAATAGTSYAFKTMAIKAKAKNVDGSGKTVLITGGSGGIGFELAKVFAEHKFNIVLAARNEEKLSLAAEELSKKYGAEVKTISVDLSSQTGARELYDELLKQNITVDQFVNNAGAGKSCDLVDTDEETLRKFMNLNVVSVTLLDRLIGADMVKRGEGKILNVASLSGYLPDPGLNVYGPTKAYERYLGEAMYGELRGTGVTVSTLCPGPVKTDWSKNAGRKDSKFSLDAESVAKEAFEKMQSDELIIVPGAHFKFLRLAATVTPTTFKIKLLRKFQNGLKGQ